MMAETGASGLRPAATTRDRRSRSVTIPSPAPERRQSRSAPGPRSRPRRSSASPPRGSARWRRTAVGGIRISVRDAVLDRVLRRRGGAVGAGRDRPRDEPEHVRAGEQRPHDIGRDAIADRVLARAGLEAGRQAGDHRRVPEQLARAQQVEDRPSWMTSTAPLRTIQTDSTGPAPCEKIVFPRGMELASRSRRRASRASSSGPTASNGGWEPRKPATSGSARASVQDGSSVTPAAASTGPARCSSRTVAPRPRCTAR